MLRTLNLKSSLKLNFNFNQKSYRNFSYFKHEITKPTINNFTLTNYKKNKYHTAVKLMNQMNQMDQLQQDKSEKENQKITKICFLVVFFSPLIVLAWFCIMLIGTMFLFSMLEFVRDKLTN